MSMTEDEMRDLIVTLWNPRTERDAQVEVGASNLSNPCDVCRAFEILGEDRDNRILDRAHGGRNVGTAIHLRLEHNIKKAAATAAEVGDDLAQIGFRYPGMVAERHLNLGELTPGRPITSSTDLWIPSKRSVGDAKGTTMRKLAFVRDALGQMRGAGPIFGRGHEFVVVFEEGVVKSGASKGATVFRKAVDGVSEREYAKGISEALNKLERYSRQLGLYGLGIENEGETVDDLFINFIARDSAMTFENRDAERYMDETAGRAIVSIRFAFNREYAAGIWKEAQAMAKALTEGTKAPRDYMSHPHCLVCTDEAKHEAKMEATAAVVVEPSTLAAVDPWAAMAATKMEGVAA